MCLLIEVQGNHEKLKVKTVKVMKEAIHGCHGLMCSCGVHQVDRTMCCHAVTLAKLGCREGLNLVNGMPYWWATDS